MDIELPSEAEAGPGPADIWLMLLKTCHSITKAITLDYVDLDELQAHLLATIPEYTPKAEIAAVVLSTALWLYLLMMLHFFIGVAMSHFRTTNAHAYRYRRWADRDKLLYSSYFAAVAAAIFTTLGGVYGLLYADGAEGTTWFHSTPYQKSMFNGQKYLNAIRCGYIIYDIMVLKLTSSGKADNMSKQIVIHHALCFVAYLSANALHDGAGSISQLLHVSALLPGLANVGKLLIQHKMERIGAFTVFGRLYEAYFVLATMLYTYLLTIGHYRVGVFSVEYWKSYPKEMEPLLVLYFLLMILMYGMHLHWFK